MTKIRSDEDIIKERVASRLYAEERERLIAERAAEQDISRQQFNAQLQAHQANEAWAIERFGRVKELRERQAALLSELGEVLGQVWEAETEALKIETEVGERFRGYILNLSDHRRPMYWAGLLARAGLRPAGETFLDLPAQTPGEKLARLVLRALAYRPSVLTPDMIVIESGDGRMWFT